MTRPNPSGTAILSLENIKARAIPMSLALPAGRERRDFARRDAIVRRIVAEFHDMPGMVLSLKQASRFLGVHEAACGRILATLTEAGVLQRSATEYYSRCESGH